MRDAYEIVPPLVLAAAALGATGVILDEAQHWSVFMRRTAYYIAMPMLFGIKGNLDLTQASRLSSAMHSGELSADNPAAARQVYQSSMALLQVQAIVLGGLAGILSVVLHYVGSAVEDTAPGAADNNNNATAALRLLSSPAPSAAAEAFVPEAPMDFQGASTVVAAVLITSSVAALVFALLTFGLVVGGKVAGCDPDNFAAPVLSSFGDVASLGLLAASAAFLDGFELWGGATGAVAPLVILGGAVLALPCLWCVAAKDPSAAEALRTGWIPILAALGLSQFAGMALEQSIVAYEGVGVFVVYITGMGGNLGCVYASRLCSQMHASGAAGAAGAAAAGGAVTESGGRFEQQRGSVGPEGLCPIGCFLLGTNAVFQCVYLALVSFLNWGHMDVSFEFSLLYLCASSLQLVVLLLFVRYATPSLYRCGVNPDNFMVPLLTALGDFGGTVLLAAVFVIAEKRKAGAPPA